jgi:hypothetical protein
MLVYFWTFRKVRGKKNVGWDVKQGLRCYSCKDDLYPGNTIEEQNERLNKINEVFNRIDIDPKSDNLKMCVTCNRDNQIEDVFNHKFLSINKIKKYLYSKKYSNTTWIYSITMFTLLVIDVIDGIYNKESIRPFFYLYNAVIYLYWSLLIYKLKLDYDIEKPADY